MAGPFAATSFGTQEQGRNHRTEEGRIRILDNAGTLRGTLGNADGLGAYFEKTYYATKKAVETTTEDGSPKKPDKPPASSDVVNASKLQSPPSPPSRTPNT